MPTKQNKPKFSADAAELKKIAARLRDGAKFKDIRDEYGLSNGQPIRRALYEAGFDTKGNENPEGLTARALREGRRTEQPAAKPAAKKRRTNRDNAAKAPAVNKRVNARNAERDAAQAKADRAAVKKPATGEEA